MANIKTYKDGTRLIIVVENCTGPTAEKVNNFLLDILGTAQPKEVPAVIPIEETEDIAPEIRIEDEIGPENPTPFTAPSPEEIAEELRLPLERVREIIRISQDPVSLETPIGEEEDSHLGDFIPDEEAPAPAEAASLTLLKEQLNEVLNTLTEREGKVLRLRFGLEDGRQRTLEEVG